MSRSDYQWGLGEQAEEIMSHEAVELTLYAQNDQAIYNAYLLPMLKACQRHYDRDNGNLERMIQGFTRAFLPISKQYVLEHCSPNDTARDLFPISVRRECADYMAHYFLGEYRLGNSWL